jgi:signal transduction histidine kinase
MIMLKDITSAIKLNEIEREKQFYEILTATFSHEMKNPINQIINSAEALQCYIPEQSEEGNKFRMINLFSSKLLLSLVNDLIDLFQIKNEQFQSKITEFNLQSALDSALEILKI